MADEALHLPGYDTIVDGLFYGRASALETVKTRPTEILCPHRYTLLSVQSMAERLAAGAKRTCVAEPDRRSALQTALSLLPLPQRRRLAYTTGAAASYAAGKFPRLTPQQNERDVLCLYLQVGLVAEANLREMCRGPPAGLAESIAAALDDPRSRAIGLGYRWGVFLRLDDLGGLPAHSEVLDAFSFTRRGTIAAHDDTYRDIARVASLIRPGLKSSRRVSRLVDISEAAFERSAATRITAEAARRNRGRRSTPDSPER